MAFSPNARAHASTSRPVQHNWPNPFLRPAANEPPRVVNVNGLTITVDRNETHIPVPQPPPQFLNHYHNFGPPVPTAIVKAKCLANWQGLQGTVTIDRLGNQWFRVEFTQEEDLVYVLENRPWFVKGRIFHMRRWTPSFSATLAKIEKLMVWVRLPFLPLHLWDPTTLERIVQVLGRYVRVDEATAMGDHCIFARVCIEIDLRIPLKRVLVLHLESRNEEVARVRVSYEALFEICFLCGDFTHRFEACPQRTTERHFLLVDRLEDEPAVFPTDMQQMEEIQNLISNDAMVIFPQPTTAYQAGNHYGDSQREVNDQSVQETQSWSLVVRGRGRGRGRLLTNRGGGRAPMGSREAVNTGIDESAPNPSHLGNGRRNAIRIRLADRQVDENNIIILSDANSNDMDNYQDANDHGTELMTGENPGNNDLLGGQTDDDVFAEEEEDPMKFEEALEFKSPRKRSRDQFASDDEMTNGSSSVNEPIK